MAKNSTQTQLSKSVLTAIEIDRVIEMAWEDRTPFEAIEKQFGINESTVIKIMRKELKRSSFNLWRKRVNSGISQNMHNLETLQSTDSSAHSNDRLHTIK
jgi:uncharacterized protein (TIGR03643 family)